MGESPKSDPKKWYNKPGTIILGFFIIGPLALPLVWINPGLNKRNKILITVVIIALTIWLTRSTVQLYKILSEHYGELDKALVGY